MTQGLWKDLRVALHRVVPGGYEDARIRSALADLTETLGWGTGADRPFSEVIPDGARVLVKPNWVIHESDGPGGIEPLLTHASLIRVVSEGALNSGAGRVTLGDAPLQSCDFDALVENTGLRVWAKQLREKDPRFQGPDDFRRTRSVMAGEIREAFEDLRPETDFVLFDLARESLLEPISEGNPEFRVTQYDPRLLENRHREGRHQYLIARVAIEADVVINLPKLKTHKKAGITCALKNLIGINGNKEFLPHHRLGGSNTGGDCYRGGGRFRLLLERTMDRYNKAGSRMGARAWRGWARVVGRIARTVDGSDEIEGAWSGNDTIWRTCLDINRILLYGRLDGTLASEPQREQLHIVDAVTAGHGDGPLSPLPLPLGLLMAGSNAAAVDWIGALLLKYDPGSVPIVREAFGSFPWPLSPGPHSDICTVGQGFGSALDPSSLFPGIVRHPSGWTDADLELLGPGAEPV